jgi:A/G-specific adenine glycosylase
LAFRRTTDPFAVLVLEAMAQQTQADRAAEAWIRFMDTFPTAAALAAATPAAALRAWRGLGYNRRALNLWRAARQIVLLHGGRVPDDLGALEALPGVGPYTARAVGAIAFGMPVGAVDTNVRRVLGRILAGGEPALGRSELQAMADAAVSPDRPGAWTHALMDIGATLCRPRRPACSRCPARAWCRFAAAESADIAAAEQVGDAAARRAGGLAPEPGRRVRIPASPRAARESAAPFRMTSRWLRGRIVDHLRAAEDGSWVVLDGPIGGHDRAAVAAALEGLARDGLIELGQAEVAGGRRARLPAG